jgi:hypothetical protein
MGGVVDHTSNILDPITTLFAGTEYNAGWACFMAASHLRMILCKLENMEDNEMEVTTIYFHSKLL